MHWKIKACSDMNGLYMERCTVFIQQITQFSPKKYALIHILVEGFPKCMYYHFYHNSLVKIQHVSSTDPEHFAFKVWPYFGKDGELVLPLLFLTFPMDKGSSQQKIIKFEKPDLDEGDGGWKNETGSLGTCVESGNMTFVQTPMLYLCLP